MIKKTGAKVECIYEIPKEIAAPVSKGESVGKIYYELNGERIGESDIVSCEEVTKINYVQILCRILMNFVMGVRGKE